MVTEMWHSFTITCPGELKEALTAALFALGCTGTTEDGGTLTAYFPGDADTDAIAAEISKFDGVSFSVNRVEEQDWYAGWKETIGPYRAAGFLICPPWKKEECAPAPGEKLILLDPGQAFGTGEHESTVNVFDMLGDWANEQGDVSGKRLLDLGTGTGILSIAAYLHGIGEITAADTEPKAVETAARNFALNGMVGKVRLLPGSIAEAGRGYDIILANIFQEVLLELMPDIAHALNPGGEAMLSGLLTGQEARVARAAAANGLGLVEKRNRGEWVSLWLSARPRPGRL